MPTGNKETRKVISKKPSFFLKQLSFLVERDWVTTANVVKVKDHGDGVAWDEAKKGRTTEDERQVLKLSPRTHHLGLLKNRENVTPGAHVMRPKGFRKLTTRAISRNEKRNWFAPNIGKNKIGLKKEQKINSLKTMFCSEAWFSIIASKNFVRFFIPSFFFFDRLMSFCRKHFFT